MAREVVFLEVQFRTEKADRREVRNMARATQERETEQACRLDKMDVCIDHVEIDR